MTYIENKWSLWWFENFILPNEKQINYNSLSRNPNLTLEILEKYPDIIKYPWYWGMWNFIQPIYLSKETLY